ncbi:hypothetical protein [Gimesia chilikensis]|uniref:Uncharacterized protein n=1 Tax=Gimesia chilikensis TaxID=2605989 RepID=A0A517PT05_9PLAN|nr:hypothetical protein [Gimesia chilikensis]QDT22504.1 hypothetical protein HG66A1_43120 [Gimesia chilikensis]
MSNSASPPHAGIDVIPPGIFAAAEPEKNHSDSSDKDEIPPGTFHVL